MTTPYPLAASTLGADELSAARAVLDSGRLTMGAEVRAFEDEVAAWTGSRHALMVNSGSSANLLMVDAMLRRTNESAPWRAGDEVLVPALAWPTTVWPLCQLGLVPVFVDVDRSTLAIDVASAKRALSPRTRGMFIIHVLGQVPDIAALNSFCREHDLHLLEDCCESLGAHFHGAHVGSFGSMGSFSCYFSHHISTIEGGFITTSDTALHDDLKSLRAHGWLRDRSDRDRWIERCPDIDPRFMFVSGGYNVRPTEIQAAIGRVQLARLDAMLEAREQLAREVHDRLASTVPWIELLGASYLPERGTTRTRRARSHSWMTLPMRVAPSAPCTAAEVKAHLERMGVETRPIIAGNLAAHPGVAQFTTRRADSLDNADEILRRGFMIGCHPVSTEGSLDTLRRALDSLRRLG